MSTGFCKKCGEEGQWQQKDDGKWFLFHNCSAYTKELIGKVGTCKLCKKEGKYDAFPLHGRTVVILKHYCPVKAQRRKDKKNKEEQEYIDRLLKDRFDRMGLEGDWETQLFQAFPYCTQEDFFAPKPEDQKLYESKWKEFTQLILKYYEEKRKRPNKTTITKFINSLKQTEERK